MDERKNNMNYPTTITDPIEITSAYHKIKYPSRRSFGEIYVDSHIFDEDKSVKWNREEVQRRNELVMEQFRAAREDYDKQLETFWSDVDKYIANEFNITLEVAKGLRVTIWSSDSVDQEIEDFQTFLEDFWSCYQVLKEANKI